MTRFGYFVLLLLFLKGHTALAAINCLQIEGNDATIRELLTCTSGSRMLGGGTADLSKASQQEIDQLLSSMKEVDLNVKIIGNSALTALNLKNIKSFKGGLTILYNANLKSVELGDKVDGKYYNIYGNSKMMKQSVDHIKERLSSADSTVVDNFGECTIYEPEVYATEKMFYEGCRTLTQDLHLDGDKKLPTTIREVRGCLAIENSKADNGELEKFLKNINVGKYECISKDVLRHPRHGMLKKNKNFCPEPKTITLQDYAKLKNPTVEFDEGCQKTADKECNEKELESGLWFCTNLTGSVLKINETLFHLYNRLEHIKGRISYQNGGLAGDGVIFSFPNLKTVIYHGNDRPAIELLQCQESILFKSLEKVKTGFEVAIDYRENQKIFFDADRERMVQTTKPKVIRVDLNQPYTIPSKPIAKPATVKPITVRPISLNQTEEETVPPAVSIVQPEEGLFDRCKKGLVVDLSDNCKIVEGDLIVDGKPGVIKDKVRSLKEVHGQVLINGTALALVEFPVLQVIVVGGKSALVVTNNLYFEMLSLPVARRIQAIDYPIHEHIVFYNNRRLNPNPISKQLEKTGAGCKSCFEEQEEPADNPEDEYERNLKYFLIAVGSFIVGVVLACISFFICLGMKKNRKLRKKEAAKKDKKKKKTANSNARSSQISRKSKVSKKTSQSEMESKKTSRKKSESFLASENSTH